MNCTTILIRSAMSLAFSMFLSYGENFSSADFFTIHFLIFIAINQVADKPKP